MKEKYCIWPEMPYCPSCPYGGIDTSSAETYDDLYDNAPWYCTLTKEKYDEYLEKGE